MFSRIILLENQLNLTKNLRPALCIVKQDCKFNFSTNCSHQAQNKSSISKHVKSSASFGEKAKEATRTTYYTAVVVLGLGAFSLLMYSIFKELISSFSPQSVYSAAADRVCADPRVVSHFGGDLKCCGETSRRGRRQHVNHLPYEFEGQKGFRIKFYLRGQIRSGTVHLDARESLSGGGWEFRYLFVQSDSYPNDVIVVEDNRHGNEAPLSSL